MLYNQMERNGLLILIIPIHAKGLSFLFIFKL
jgi:hypothetical protein